MNTEKCFVIEIKSTTLNEDNILEVETSVSSDGYADKTNAKEVIKNLADKKAEECEVELDYPKEEISISASEDETYQCVECGSNTYEFSVIEITIH